MTATRGEDRGAVDRGAAGRARGGPAGSFDPALVEERIGRLTTDALVTRRGYLHILAVLSGGLALGNVAVALGAFRRRTQEVTAEVRIVADAAAVPVGGSVRFLYPGRLDPALLLRLDEDLYVAYSVICTHLQCEVLHRPRSDELYCPCHEGFFDPRTGAPIAGPPQRPLPEIVLERRGDAIVAIGEGNLGGRDLEG